MVMDSVWMQIELLPDTDPSYVPLLEMETPDTWQLPEEVLVALAVPPDAVVADIGAGGVYFTERFARCLLAGRVYVADAQDEMIERLDERVGERALDNVTVVRGSFDDPGLPEECCDLIFLSSVYKELDGRVAYMGKVRRLLRSGGRVASDPRDPTRSARGWPTGGDADGS
jgi:ubiquinone/menaquinone biosynthesis C-methylase UbiE